MSRRPLTGTGAGPVRLEQVLKVGQLRKQKPTGMWRYDRPVITGVQDDDITTIVTYHVLYYLQELLEDHDPEENKFFDNPSWNEAKRLDLKNDLMNMEEELFEYEKKSITPYLGRPNYSAKDYGDAMVRGLDYKGHGIKASVEEFFDLRKNPGITLFTKAWKENRDALVHDYAMAVLSWMGSEDDDLVYSFDNIELNLVNGA